MLCCACLHRHSLRHARLSLVWQPVAGTRAQRAPVTSRSQLWFFYMLMGPKSVLYGDAERAQAHRLGAVTALARTPWGDLWSGTSRGWMRAWGVARSGAFSRGRRRVPAAAARAAPHGGLRPHSSGVSHMLCPPGGQVRGAPVLAVASPVIGRRQACCGCKDRCVPHAVPALGWPVCAVNL